MELSAGYNFFGMTIWYWQNNSDWCNNVTYWSLWAEWLDLL